MTNHQQTGAPVIIVMGVTGSGKSTIGSLLARKLNLPFYDADDFHPPANQAKLAADIPLNDADREPWLADLTEGLSQWAARDGAVLACSALRHRYRSRFRSAAPQARFIYLEGDPNLIASRVHHRAQTEAHVVKEFAAILEGQFRDLEVPVSAIRVNIEKSPEEIVDEIAEKLQLPAPPAS